MTKVSDYVTLMPYEFKEEDYKEDNGYHRPHGEKTDFWHHVKTFSFDSNNKIMQCSYHFWLCIFVTAYEA